MKYQFNFFGLLFFVLIFLLLSSMGLVQEEDSSTDVNDPADMQLAGEQTLDDNSTGNQTQNGTSEENATNTSGWRPPLENKTMFKAGSTIPIKFAYYGNGSFIVDENVTVMVIDEGNNTIANFSVGKNPSQGIAIQSTQYHVNWKTPKGAVGNCTIIASFSDGFILTKDITLF